MMNTKNCIFIFLLFILFIQCKTPVNKDDYLRLWYDSPATDWMTEALPVGNGYMGVMFFGGIEQEQIQFSDGTLWTGGPGADERYNFGLREGASDYLPEVRKLLEENKFNEADALARKELTGIINRKQGDPSFGDYGAQQTMGDLFIRVGTGGTPENYIREIDLEKGEGNVSYQLNGTKYKRTYFGDYPNKIMVYHFESSKNEDYDIEYRSPHQKITETFDGDTYSWQGRVAGNGMEYETCFKLETDGIANFENGVLHVSSAKSLTLYHTAATDYEMKFPTYKGNNYLMENDISLSSVSEKNYKEIRKKHINDYQNLYSRVKIKLGENAYDTIPTDQRLMNYANGVADPGLEQIYFQYSRYLMISASRPGTMPMHLQGKWNNSTDPPWACDYHTNINLQMLYWPAEVVNLSECHIPLFDYMESLVEPGQKAAKEFFNARGWTVNTMNNAFGYTATGWDFPWGFFPGGAAWLCQHAWEHYAFTQDTVFLSETAYPLMKEAALFWMDYLTEDENGLLVSIPSYSPEHGGISKGTSMDHQIAWDVLNNCIQACEILQVDEDFKIQITVTRNKIFPPTIGSWGQLQEWKEDVDDPNNSHRHVSHLFALHPGKQITTETTPELAEAARVSLNARGDDGTGWSLAWKINFWARLKDGDRAYRLLRKLLQPVVIKETNYTGGGGTYSNLFCAHPPFQLDGNMGGATGIAEMLLQSHTGIIELLPSLPDSWKNGSVDGLKARGNYEIGMVWEVGKLIQVRIKGNPGNVGKYKYLNQITSFEIPGNGELKINL